MIVPRHTAGAILHGEDEIIYPYEPPPVGSIRAIQTRVGKPATCYVLIEDTWPITAGEHAGEHAVRLKLHHLEQPRRLLRRGGGYTDQTDKAIQDPELGAEPEGVSDDELNRMVADNRTRASRRRAKTRQEQQALNLEAKIVAYQREAEMRRIPIRDEMKALRRMLNRGRNPENGLLGIEHKLDRDLDRAA